MIKFLQLLTIDRPILSFLFANACSSILLLVVLSFFDFMFVYVSCFLKAITVNGFVSEIGHLILFAFAIFFKCIFLICYSEIVLKEKQNNICYKFISLLKNNNIFRLKFLYFIFFIEMIFFLIFFNFYLCLFLYAHCFFFVLPLFIFIDLLFKNLYKNNRVSSIFYKIIDKLCIIIDKIIIKSVKLGVKYKKFLFILILILFLLLFNSIMYMTSYIFIFLYLLFSLFFSYLLLFIYWNFRDVLKDFFVKIKKQKGYCFLLKCTNKIYNICFNFINKYQVFAFLLINLLCSSYVFMYFTAMYYDFMCTDILKTILLEENDYLVGLISLNYLYQLIRYILIFKVFDIYSKLESGLIVDFIKKLKTSSKCRNVTSIVLFAIDTFFILLLSRGTSCNHTCIYWIMSYFFGLMSMYFVMFYYWHLENKHKDVLAEVEVKEDTGVL